MILYDIQKSASAGKPVSSSFPKKYKLILMLVNINYLCALKNM